MEFLVILALMVIVAVFWIGLPMDMAEKRGRSVGGWLVASLLFGGPLVIFLLLVLGPSNKLGVSK